MLLKLTIAVTLVISLFCSCVPPRELGLQVPDHEIETLEPRDVVQLYWKAALLGDVSTITRLVGGPHDSMLWDCPPTTSTEDSGLKGVYSPEGSVGEPGANVTQVGSRDDPNYNLDAILLHASVIKVARKTLASDYDFGEENVSEREARLLVKPRTAPDSFNSLVFFLLKADNRWRIVDIRVEDHLQFVGNKKFGKNRSCP